MGKSDELVKYLTERLVAYIETPRDVRRQVREREKTVREDWVYRWFGLVPFSLKMWIGQRRAGRKQKDAGASKR